MKIHGQQAGLEDKVIHAGFMVAQLCMCVSLF